MGKGGENFPWGIFRRVEFSSILYILRSQQLATAKKLYIYMDMISFSPVQFPRSIFTCEKQLAERK